MRQASLLGVEKETGFTLNYDNYCVVNNTYVPQDTTAYTDTGSFDLHLEANEILWYEI